MTTTIESRMIATVTCTVNASVRFVREDRLGPDAEQDRQRQTTRSGTTPDASRGQLSKT